MPQISHPDTELNCHAMWNHSWEMFRVTHHSPFFHLSTLFVCSLRTNAYTNLRNCCKPISQRKKFYVFAEEKIYQVISEQRSRSGQRKGFPSTCFVEYFSKPRQDISPQSQKWGIASATAEMKYESQRKSEKVQ